MSRFKFIQYSVVPTPKGWVVMYRYPWARFPYWKDCEAYGLRPRFFKFFAKLDMLRMMNFSRRLGQSPSVLSPEKAEMIGRLA